MNDAAIGNALTNREWAVLVWLAVFVFLAMPMKEVRSGLWDILKILAHPKIAIPVAIFGSFIAGVVLIGWRFDAWNGDLIKDTIMCPTHSATVATGSSLSR